MISHVEVKNRVHLPFKWITEETSPFQNGERYDFAPIGINLLVGPNGSGKSTLLKTISKFTMCNLLGIPFIAHRELQEMEDYFPSRYMYMMKDRKKPGLHIEKDDGLCYYMKSGKLIGTAGQTTSYPLDGHLNEAKISWENQRCSDGQSQIRELNRFIERFDKHTSPLVSDTHIWDKYDQEKLDLANSWMGSGNGTPTMLLDEPDRNLDFVQSEKLWEALFSVSHRYQIIVVSHYLPILLRQSNLNIITLKDDLYKDQGIESYLQHCKAYGKEKP